MTDPWEVLDRAINVIEVTTIAYFLYRNRDLLLGRQGSPVAASAEVTATSSAKATATVIKGADSDEPVGTLKAIPGAVNVLLKGVPSDELVGTLHAQASPIEELLWWYLRVR